MADIVEIAPSNLLVDPINPRLLKPNSGQRETQRDLAQHLQRKILALAKDIVAYGLNPADLPIVVAANDRENRFLVLEGNRRMVALRALENPDSFVGAFDNNTLSAMRDLARVYQNSPIDGVNCVLMESRDEAEHWIRLRHTGENQGAGIVPWGANETARFRSRSGPRDITTQALDYMERHGALTLDERSMVPATNLKRLLGTPEMRANIGLGLQGRDLIVMADDAKVIKALKYVIDDLCAENGTKVKDIYSKEQRRAYAARLPKSVAVKATKSDGHTMDGSEPKTKGKAKAAKKTKPARPRDNLISLDCVLGIDHDRISAIEGELRILSLKSHTNAISVLLRVFIELSADEYIAKHSLATTPHDKLRNKLNSVLDHLLLLKKLTAQQAKPVRKAMAKDSYLAPSIDLMHDYIHNQHVFPAPGDLLAHWNSLQPFIMGIWSA